MLQRSLPSDYPLTDRLQFDILRSGPGWRGPDAIRSNKTARVIRLIFRPVKWALLTLKVSGTLLPRHFGFILRSRLTRSPRRRAKGTLRAPAGQGPWRSSG